MCPLGIYPLVPSVISRVRRRSVGHDDAGAGPSTVGSKRLRNLESHDETEPPPKRIRLRRPSARTLRAVIFHLVTFYPLIPYHYRPIHNSQPSLRNLLLL